MSRATRIFLSVAEDSADAYGAALARQLAITPDIQLSGLTGPRMRAAGVETVFDLAAHAAMLTGALSLVGRAMRAMEAIDEAWKAATPDACVLIDSPELNLRIARRARERGIPVLYYVAPQTWASREYRNKAIARDVDHLACILPFEEAFFRAAGVRATFVGHPLFEVLRGEPDGGATRGRLRRSDGPLLALLPGSRKHVIRSTLPLQLSVLRGLKSRGAAVRAAVSAVDSERANVIGAILRHEGFRPNFIGTAGVNVETGPADDGPPGDPIVDVVVADNPGLLTAADLVLVASGTATLHVAHYGKPMIVLYDAGWLGRVHAWSKGWIIRTPHLSLVNILAGRRVVPEFMPSVPESEPIVRVALELLSDPDRRDRMARSIEETIAPLRHSQPTATVAGLVRQLSDPSTTN